MKYIEHISNITNRMIVELFGEIEKVVSVWKQCNGWNVTQQSKPKIVQQNKRGSQPDTKIQKPTARATVDLRAMPEQ